MAEESGGFDKTEEPTQKRLDEALKRGDVVKSQEVNTWFVIAGATLVLMAFSGSMSKDLAITMRGLIANSYNISVDGPALPRLFQKIGGEMVAAVAVPFLVLILAAIGGNVIQHRLVWSYQTLAPKLSKISPLAGLKRIFSKQALANLTKGLVKLAVVGTVMFLCRQEHSRDQAAQICRDIAGFSPLTNQPTRTYSMRAMFLGETTRCFDAGL